MKYHITTYGCEMNRSDSFRIAAVLENKNHKKASRLGEADLVIINVCSVKQRSIDKVKNQISRLRQERRQIKIVLTGCVLETDRKEFKKLGIEIKKFDEIKNIKPISGLVPIARGCNNFCSYCAVPYTRGREKYSSQKDIIAEVRHLIKKGHKKITLLGQNVNSYPNFAELLKKITALSGNFKIKFITNHPKDVSDELIKEMASNPKIVKYIHLPFQSGDNLILKKMNRHYTRAQYLKLIAKLKKAMPDIEITSDAIVGFPSETKAQFQKTVEVIKKVGFSQVFIGKYSPRPSTAAAKLKDNVPLVEKKRREQVLLKLIDKGRPKQSLLRADLNKLVVILGATGVGKTSLSIKLAKKFNGEVVSADSRQLYKYMDIGTGKITKKEMASVPHHLLDVAMPEKLISVAEYQKLAIESIDQINKKNKLAFLVGGSAFYIYSVVEGWQFPKMKKNEKLRKELEKKTAEQLFKMLKGVDPERAKTIESKNKRRLVRAIEIASALGKVPKIKKSPKYDVLLIGLKFSRQELEKRISKRVDKMIEAGLEKEVKNLSKKYGFNEVLSQSIDYQEWQDYFEDKINKKALIESINRNHLRLSKRQMTWFKRDQNIHWITTDGQAEKLINSFLK